MFLLWGILRVLSGCHRGFWGFWSRSFRGFRASGLRLLWDFEFPVVLLEKASDCGAPDDRRVLGLWAAFGLQQVGTVLGAESLNP